MQKHELSFDICTKLAKELAFIGVEVYSDWAKVPKRADQAVIRKAQPIEIRIYQ